jgi:polyhydroxybutyrate depolymerase
VRLGLKIAGASLGVLVLAALGFWSYAVYRPVPPARELPAQTIRVGDRDRTYLAYQPAHLASPLPLVVAFHGSTQTGAEMRVSTGFELERLADENGFLVVYPDGFGHNWNDCRRAANFPARTLHIDDVGFFLALVEKLHVSAGVDPARVFALGYSNGGHFAYRLALEHPDRVAGIAAFAASLPADDNLDCKLSGAPVPVMIADGTLDPLSPFEGGDMSLFGFRRRGRVRSARASADYFAGLAGLSEPARSRLPESGELEGTWVEVLDWRAPGRVEVLFDAVHGGGHVVPQPVVRPPRILGKASPALNGLVEAWRFFARQPPADARGAP